MKPYLVVSSDEDISVPLADVSAAMDQVPAAKYGNTSMFKCFDILEALGASREPLSLACIRTVTGLNKTTAFRLLQVLKDMGYVARSEAGYELGYRLYRLTLKMSGSAAIQRLANRFLVRLAADVRETVHLAVLEQTKAVYIDKIDTERGLSVKSNVGMRLDAHATAVGKALLAYQSPEALRELYANSALQAHTNRTVTDPAQLQRLLKQVRTQGFAVDNEELELGLRCVAAPIMLGDGEAACAVSISGPTVRITDTAFPGLIAELKRCARAIEASLAPAGKSNAG